MNTNLKNPQSSSPVKAQASSFTESLDFECWAREVRTQLLAALQKKAANSPGIGTNKLKKAKPLGSD